MNHTNRIAIVGAGIAGMALAIFVKKQGYQVSLFERSTEVSSIGAGVTLWPNAMFVLSELGLEAKVNRVAGAPTAMVQFDQHGKQNGEFDLTDVNKLSGFPTATILRRDLMNILAKALIKLDINIHFGSSMSVVDISQLQLEFDLVVGADGRMNSVVRQALFADKVHPVYQGFINIIGVAQLKEGMLANAVHDYRGHGERFGIVPIKDGLCFWAAAWNTNIDTKLSRLAWHTELVQRFQSWHDPVQQVMRNNDNVLFRPIFVHDLDPLPYWHRDNVLIIGDAAHAPLPTSGQGACQALEDAWHLSQLLAKQESLDDILIQFYNRRIDKTYAVQAVGRQVAKDIFGERSDTKSFKPAFSAKQLSQFWMQGLEVS